VLVATRISAVTDAAKESNKFAIREDAIANTRGAFAPRNYFTLIQANDNLTS